MQTSMVFNQVRWPGAGDVDDCWAVSAIQAVSVTSPWLRLVGVPAFRREAGNPDDPREPDGGTLAQIVRGIEGCYPSLAGHVRRLAGVSWATFLARAHEKRPLSISIVSARLAPELRFGFDGRHQITAVERDASHVLYANPLAPVYSRWLRVRWEDLRLAALAYGEVRAGHPCVYAAALPTDREALALWRPDTTPFDQDDIDAATAELQRRIDAARQVLEGG